MQRVTGPSRTMETLAPFELTIEPTTEPPTPVKTLFVQHWLMLVEQCLKMRHLYWHNINTGSGTFALRGPNIRH